MFVVSLLILFTIFILSKNDEKIFNVNINKTELRIMIMGDFGYSEKKSTLKKNVVKKLTDMNLNVPFDLGLILGDNVYPFGASTGNYESINEVFAHSFPKSTFPIQFLTIHGNHEYYGDTNTGELYYKEVDSRYGQFFRYYLYQINMNNFNISFICVDSTPLMEQWFYISYAVDDQVQKKKLEEFFEKSKYSTYTFVLSHHNVAQSFGPHNDMGKYNYLNNLINNYKTSGVIGGHNHNMQFIPPGDHRKYKQFTVGNSAKMSKVLDSKAYTDGWYHDQSGGFATMTLNSVGGEFIFYKESGEVLKTVKIEQSN